ncbi:MAG: HXXEE domain-containing protein [Gaiellaceae bacterium]
MSDALRSILTGTAGLDVAAVVALVLTLRRALRATPPRFLLIGWIALGLQGLHFVEEWLTGFEVRFPLLLGLNPWPAAFFVSFNLAWLAIWAIALLMVRRFRIALFPLWFLAIAAIANGIAHPLASLGMRGYFPGMVTAPLLGVAGVLLFSRLMASTQPTAGVNMRLEERV